MSNPNDDSVMLGVLALGALLGGILGFIGGTACGQYAVNDLRDEAIRNRAAEWVAPDPTKPQLKFQWKGEAP